MTRLFYGVALPPDLKQQLGQVQQELQSLGVAARNWSDPALFHLTVLFLGELPFEKFVKLDEIGYNAGRQTAPFQLTLGELGVFPKNKVLWTGLQRDAGMTALEALHVRVRDAVAKDEVVSVESRPYRAHLTLARQVQPSSFDRVEQRHSLPADVLTSRTFSVTHLCLFESTREHGKLVYPVRRRYPLGVVSI